MFRKLPAEFNAAWYVATYPDVAQSGLSPREHYLRFGRLMGRKPAGPPKVQKSPPTGPELGRQIDTTPNIEPRSQTGTPTAEPIIGRPDGFDVGESVPTQAAPRIGPARDVERLAMGPFISDEERDQLLTPLIAYARLMSLELPAGLSDPQNAVHCASARFRAGQTRIETAWFASQSVLRLRIVGGVDAGSSSRGWILRAYQFNPEVSGGLRPAGEGIEFPAFGPIFHDVELHHPLMPLLMELTDAVGKTRGLALLPFPSLLPGGMHAAELNALQSESNPMDAFWSLSDLLLRELLGQSGWADRSVAALSLRPDREGMSCPTSVAEVREWLAGLFGFDQSPEPSAAPDTPAMRLQRNDASGGLELMLPTDCIPTISVLVSRQLELEGAATLTGPLLVAESPSYRPRWSVMLPAGREFEGKVPILRSETPLTDSEPRTRTVPVHLAIALRSANFPLEAVGSKIHAPAAGAKPALEPTTVVVDAHDLSRTERLLTAIQEAAGGVDLELVVRLPEVSEQLSELVDGIWGSGNWTAVPADADLRDLAARARHDTLLTVSDRLVSVDPVVVAALASIIRDDDAVASASCTLLAEMIIKKKTVVQPATGGLFPTGVSFTSAPRLSFSEPDVSQSLPDMTYPVVANTLHLTAWRRSALAGLPRPAGPVPSAAEDIRLGLDLINAGYGSVCTSRVTAHLSGSYARRDAIDPVGSSYPHPAWWEDVLGRVTVLRELF